MQASTASAREPFTALDWIGVVAAGFSCVSLLAFPIAGRAFAQMFEDVGSRASMPLLTQLATSFWFPLVLAVPVGTCLGFGLQRRRPLQGRRAWVAGAFVLGCLFFGLCLVGTYLPVFAIADAVKAE